MSAQKYVVLTLDGERFGLPIACVEQILQSVPVTRIPKASKGVLGVFDLRGSTVPVLDLRTLLSMPKRDHETFVVVSAGGQRVALTADRVDKIEEFSEADIEENEGLAAGEIASKTGRNGDVLTLLFEPESLIPDRIKKKLEAYSEVECAKAA